MVRVAEADSRISRSNNASSWLGDIRAGDAHSCCADYILFVSGKRLDKKTEQKRRKPKSWQRRLKLADLV